MQLAAVYLHQLRKVTKTNRVFYLSFCVIWLSALYFQLTVSQFDLSVRINNLNTAIADIIMTFTTYAGDGLFLLVVGIILTLINRKLWLVTLLCLAVPSVVTQILKHTIFEDSHRPAILMGHIQGLHFIERMEINQHNSFPSGHTTAAFSLYTLLALLSPKKNFGWIWVLIASSIALSRVYLLQHFWADIVAGSILAVFIVTFIYTFFAAKLHPDEITSQ